MVLSKAELIGALQKEVRILVHLAGKVQPSERDYRPTPKQRSTFELLKYLSIMGPELTKAAQKGGFDRDAWVQANTAAEARSFEQTVAAIAAQEQTYATLLGGMSDADFRAEMSAFDGSPTTKGAFIVNLVLGGHAAYRTQLFCYLKTCGHDALGTMNLWQGVDAPAPASV